MSHFFIKLILPTVLAKAINSLSRFGSELYFEATANELILRSVNEPRTAFALMKFEAGFFTEFKIDRSTTDDFCNKCKISMKSCLGVFKNMRQVRGKLFYSKSVLIPSAPSGGMVSDYTELENIKDHFPIQLPA